MYCPRSTTYMFRVMNKQTYYHVNTKSYIDKTQIFVKCLVLRMKQVLPDRITPYQYAFILGHSMIDNNMLSHELLRDVNQKKIVSAKFVVAKMI